LKFFAEDSRMKLNSVLRTAFLMVFAFALMSTPTKGLAQSTATPAAKTNATTPAPDESTRAENDVAKEEGKPAGEGDDVFRHSPMVQKLANLFHLDVETAARLFEIINFLIIVFGIGIPLFKIMPKVLKNRREALTKSIEEARAVSIDAQTRLSAVEAKLSNLSTEIHSFRTQVEQESAGDEARIKATVEEERGRIVQAASQEIQQATAQAQRTLRQFAADLALEHAVKQLKLNEETDRALIEEFIKDVTTDVTANTNGGKH
jgi:F-type H+-transporting ATPase subunit b